MGIIQGFFESKSEPEEQAEQLDRVSVRIAGAIVQFMAGNREFFADDLRRSVAEQVGKVAPGSADRVMRDLRQRGVIDYRCVSRKESKYVVLMVNGQQGNLF